ncbi:hypothetical protein [Streptomyces sp. Agncl-13]
MCAADGPMTFPGHTHHVDDTCVHVPPTSYSPMASGSSPLVKAAG